MIGANQVVPAGEMLKEYLSSENRQPLFLLGDALTTLATFPADCIDCCMTSPPYWGQRAYSGGGIGLEETFGEYIENLLAITAEVKRTLKSTASFWLNIGDAYQRKSLARDSLAGCPHYDGSAGMDPAEQHHLEQNQGRPR